MINRALALLCRAMYRVPHDEWRGRVGEVYVTRPRPRLITSPDRPGLPDFLMYVEKPGYKATEKCWSYKATGSVTLSPTPFPF